MTAIAVIVLLVLLAFLAEYVWRRADRKHEEASRECVEDLVGLGEVVAPSIHPLVDPLRCVGSGCCISGCPEKGVLGLIDGRAVLINPLGCIGHGTCAAACPFDAITLVFGSSTKGVELPSTDEHFETNQPGMYVIGELSGMGLIRNAAKQGAAAAAHVCESQRRGGGDVYDAVVIGAGPAGIAATLGCMEKGLRVALLEREAYGGAIVHYPRAKVVMTGDFDMPIHGTIKGRIMLKEELLDVFETIRKNTGLQVEAGELMTAVEPEPGGTWRVTSTSRAWRTANVLLALGLRGAPRKLGVPGEELSKVHYRLLEPSFFSGKHALVVGGGNSAVESALSLADSGCCASVSISYRRGNFARCRRDNRIRIDECISKAIVRAYLPSTIESISENEVLLKNGESPEAITNDAIIVQIGGTQPTDLLRSIGIEIVTKYGEP